MNFQTAGSSSQLTGMIQEYTMALKRRFKVLIVKTLLLLIESLESGILRQKELAECKDELLKIERGEV